MYTRTNTYVSIFSVILQTYSACLLHPARGRDRDRHSEDRERVCVRRERKRDSRRVRERESAWTDMEQTSTTKHTFYKTSLIHVNFVVLES